MSLLPCEDVCASEGVMTDRQHQNWKRKRRKRRKRKAGQGAKAKERTD